MVLENLKFQAIGTTINTLDQGWVKGGLWAKCGPIWPAAAFTVACGSIQEICSNLKFPQNLL